jgi:YidC/Oxa1 family membrane protein insertase
VVVVYTPLSWVLANVYHAVAGVPFLYTIGAYGIAIIALTLMVRLVLSPLYHFQLSVSRKTMREQRKIAPEMAALKKKYKSDPQKQQAAMMELYKEHGVNPVGGLIGCLPAVVQIPILSALYYVFRDTGKNFADHFLWVPHLNAYPGQHQLIPGIPVPVPVYLVIPVLAAATTFVQSRMMQQPPNPAATEQEQQAAQMNQSMQVVMPLMILYFAFVTPAGLGLYWFISNCFAIVQQYFVTGWGGLRGYRQDPPEAPNPKGSSNPNGKPKPPMKAVASTTPARANGRPRRARR